MVATAAQQGIARAQSAVRSFVADPRTVLLDALEREWVERRFFLWLPVCSGAGVVLYFAADREPSLFASIVLATLSGLVAAALRHRRAAFVVSVGLFALLAGFAIGCVRTRMIAHPVATRIGIATLSGVVEEVDPRRTGARFVLRIDQWSGPVGAMPLSRVRLTTRRDEPIEAGSAVVLKARLVPPAHAVLPGGYDFARDAYFAGLDAVGSVLGRITPAPHTTSSTWLQRASIRIDRFRNALARHIAATLDGDTGAIAAAMVTGKRDLLSEDGRDLIRQAGIFHIITIAGVQMTLVAGILFGLSRSLLALFPDFSSRYPAKKWAAAAAMVGAIGYDLLTGSRIGTQRALIMTLVLFGAILVDRRAFTMRNLALAALAVTIVEPETLFGASFQLSFAAVAALVAVQEWRTTRKEAQGTYGALDRRNGFGAAGLVLARGRVAIERVGHLLFATLCATSATAPFMASAFHEISPYVAIGNPLTLTMIEFFAVPAALLGAVLYPLGLDTFIWHWLGWGIELVLWVARRISAMPGATLHLPAFAPWTPACFALAIACVVIWRSPALRLTAVPLLLIGVGGALGGQRLDLVIAPAGDTLAFREATGRLSVLGRSNAFGTAQWLAADGVDPGTLDDEPTTARCDPSACVATVLDGRTLSLVRKPDAFEEDCARVDIIVTPLYAPASCGAEMIIDRGSLSSTGAVSVALRGEALVQTPTRAAAEDRPWSPAPIERHTPARRASSSRSDSDGDEEQ